MSTPISGNSTSLQALKAQQAWEARKAVSKNRIDPTADTNVQAVANKPAGNQARMVDRTQQAPDTNESSMDHNARLARAIPEIQEIAKKAGFVGVTSQDIQRAYAFGESLLTDYRV